MRSSLWLSLSFLFLLLLGCGRAGVDPIERDAQVCATPFCNGFGESDGSVGLFYDASAALDGSTQDGSEPADGAATPDDAETPDDADAAPNGPDGGLEPDSGGPAPLPVESLVGMWRWETKRVKRCGESTVEMVEEPYMTESDVFYVQPDLDISGGGFSDTHEVVSLEDDVLVTESTITDIFDASRQWRSVIELRLIDEDLFEGVRRVYDISNASSCSGGDANRVIGEFELRGERIP